MQQPENPIAHKPAEKRAPKNDAATAAATATAKVLSKKQSGAAPAEHVAEAVNGGKGKAAKGETARLNVDVPIKTHQQFKGKTASKGLKMSDLVNEWIEAYIKQA